MPGGGTKMQLSGNLSLTQGNFTLATGDFSLPAKGVTAILGLSGSGKTTFLRSLAGFEENAQGKLTFGEDIWLDEKKSTPVYQRQLGYVFQEASLFVHLNVEQNLNYGLKRAKKQINITFLQVVEWLGLDALLAREVINLSGGEKQRVAIGRALLSQPSILMMDEPLSSLDIFSKRQIMPYIEKLRDELSIPILYISHSVEEIARLADTVVFMEKGNITAIEPIENALNKKDSPIYAHEEPRAILPAMVKKHFEEDGLSELFLGNEILYVPMLNKPLGESVRVVIAANQISLTKEKSVQSSMLNNLSVTIEAIEPFNEYSQLVALKIEKVFVPLFAQITNRSVKQLNLQPNQQWIAAIKTVSIL